MFDFFCFVFQRMAVYLKEKRDVGFFTAMSGLMNSCSVLDLDAFERIIKAEGLGVNSEPSPTETNNENAANTCKLFRFLQLLCEGHNAGNLGEEFFQLEQNFDSEIFFAVQKQTRLKISLENISKFSDEIENEIQ